MCQDNRFKKCTKCKQIKNINEFRKQSGRKDNLSSNCKKCSNETIRLWYIKNKSKRLKQIKKYKSINKEKDKKWQRNWHKKQRKINPQYKLKCCIRGRIRDTVKRGFKSDHSIKLAGCTVEEYINYIESLWGTGMNWNNWGNKVGYWHLDHVIPCELFDLTKESHQRVCFNYKNTKPIWKHENESKSDLINGNRARDMSEQEKLNYLESLGYKFS